MIEKLENDDGPLPRLLSQIPLLVATNPQHVRKREPEIYIYIFSSEGRILTVRLPRLF